MPVVANNNKNMPVVVWDKCYRVVKTTVIFLANIFYRFLKNYSGILDYDGQHPSRIKMILKWFKEIVFNSIK